MGAPGALSLLTQACPKASPSILWHFVSEAAVQLSAHAHAAHDHEDRERSNFRVPAGKDRIFDDARSPRAAE